MCLCLCVCVCVSVCIHIPRLHPSPRRKTYALVLLSKLNQERLELNDCESVSARQGEEKMPREREPVRGGPHPQGTHTEGRTPQRTHHRGGGARRGPTQNTHRQNTPSFQRKRLSSSQAIDSPCECEHKNPDYIDARLLSSSAEAPAVTMDKASSLSQGCLVFMLLRPRVNPNHFE